MGGWTGEVQGGYEVRGSVRLLYLRSRSSVPPFPTLTLAFIALLPCAPPLASLFIKLGLGLLPALPPTSPTPVLFRREEPLGGGVENFNMLGFKSDSLKACSREGWKTLH